MNVKRMSYRRMKRSVVALAMGACFIMLSLTYCSDRTDWKPGSISNFEPAYYNKCRGNITDCDSNVLATTNVERRMTKKRKPINKNKYHRIYYVDAEYANVIGSIVNLQARVKDKKTGEWKYYADTQGPEGGERAFSRWLLTGDDPSSSIGGSLQLTINSRIQKTAYMSVNYFSKKHHEKQNANKDKSNKMDYCTKGAAVVMDIQTGALLAYADIPSVAYSDIAKVKYTDQLVDYKDPYNDKVLFRDGTLYDYCNALNTPGSTFKLLSASVLCDVGVCNSKTMVRDPGVFEYNVSDNGKYSRKIYDHDRKKVTKNHKTVIIPKDKGTISVKTGISDSLNVVFAQLAQKADRNEYRRIMHDTWHFNVGYRFEEDDPSYDDYSRIRTDFGGIRRPSLNVDNNQLYFDTSYGLGEVLVSPIYTTMVTSAIASDSGDLLRPYMVKTYFNNQGREVSYEKASYGLKQSDVLTKNAVSEEAHHFITDAMKNHSVALKYNQMSKYKIGVKTGTAGLGLKSNISMTGFVEDKTGKPRYAITVSMFEMRPDTLGGGSLAEGFYSIVDELTKLPEMK